MSNRETVVNNLITSNMGVVYTIAGSFVQTMPSTYPLHDDMVSEGLLALTESANGLSDERLAEPDISQYLAACVRNRLRRFVRGETGIASNTTQLQHEAVGDDSLPTVEARGLEPRLKESDPTTDLFQSLLDLCDDDNDRVIVDMRSKGHVNDYIAHVLNINEKTVRRRLAALKEKYDSTHSA